MKAASPNPQHQTASQLGEMLVERRVVSREVLDKALKLQRRWGTRLGDILIAKRWATAAQVYPVLAEQLSCVLVDLESDPAEETLFDPAKADRYCQMLLLPYRRAEGKLLLVTPDPTAEHVDFARENYDEPFDLVIAPKTQFLQELHRLCGPAFSKRALTDLASRDARFSASQVFAGWQLLGAFLGVMLSLIVFAFWPVQTVITLNMAIAAFLMVSYGFKFTLVWVGSDAATNVKVTEEEVRRLDERDLPVYTVLVPMYKEAAVLPALVAALRKMDYPLSKLDVKLILEEDDIETQEAARALNLESTFETVIVPYSLPKTKPKACNFALPLSRGEFLAIYDAEDQPEPDQLKKAVIVFRKAPPNTACVQCRLNFYNSEENWLTRMFTLEYSLWFDFFLPALERLGMPIPLGGTSNHFRMTVLRELYGWDPFNVTEDADLGVRLNQKGYIVAVANSTTLEEANPSIPNWIRQRSRWMKGYMQTYLVHMRSPLRLARTLGFRAVFGFHFFLGGTFLTALVTPFLWATYLVWVATRVPLDFIFPPLVFYLSLFNLLTGNAFFILVTGVATFRRGLYRLLPFMITVPAYWMLLSWSAWKGLIQLVTKPFFWEKTTHGISCATAQQREASLAGMRHE